MLVSPIQLTRYHVSVAAVVAALPSESIPRYVDLKEVNVYNYSIS